jgi:hypothetical protein
MKLEILAVGTVALIGVYYLYQKGWKLILSNPDQIQEGKAPEMAFSHTVAPPPLVLDPEDIAVVGTVLPCVDCTSQTPRKRRY